jgi:hypothetical protein
MARADDVPRTTAVRSNATRRVPNAEMQRGTEVCTCTLTFAKRSRSMCRAVANRELSSQGERVRSSHGCCKIASAFRLQASISERMSALWGNDVPPRMVWISGSLPHTASVGVRSVRSQVQDACLALSLIDRPSHQACNISLWCHGNMANN